MIIAPLITRFEKLICRFPLFVQLYSRPYIKIVDREISLAKINCHDEVINVGCGAIPFTAILLAFRTGAKVRALDYDPQAVESARRCIAAMGLSDRISVCHERGETTESSGFTAAVIALQARPKQEIIDNLRLRGSPGVRIIARRPKSNLLGEYDALPIDLPMRAVTLHPEMHTFDGSVLFIMNP